MGGPRLLAALFAAALLRAESSEALLAKVDRLRHPWPSFTVEVEIADAKSAQRWRVRARENGDARVEGLSAKEAGRAVLLLGEQMWLLLPTAKRPVKVTPQQRLLGAAAGGDVARTRFAEDYRVAGSTEADLEGKACLRLELEALRPSTSFRRAFLWVTAQGVPLRGEFHLLSGKLAKRVRFDPPEAAAGVQVLPGMELEEPSGTKAKVRFRAWTPGRHDPALFALPEAK